MTGLPWWERTVNTALDARTRHVHDHRAKVREARDRLRAGLRAEADRRDAVEIVPGYGVPADSSRPSGWSRTKSAVSAYMREMYDSSSVASTRH